MENSLTDKVKSVLKLYIQSLQMQMSYSCIYVYKILNGFELRLNDYQNYQVETTENFIK